ncbi:MAG: hypothetical protein ACI9N3_002141 [Colwellia sp.]|jgi:hypothetical protein
MAESCNCLSTGVIIGVLMGPDLGLLSAGTVKIITAWIALLGQVFFTII